MLVRNIVYTLGTDFASVTVKEFRELSSSTHPCVVIPRVGDKLHFDKHSLALEKKHLSGEYQVVDVLLDVGERTVFAALKHS